MKCPYAKMRSKFRKVGLIKPVERTASGFLDKKPEVKLGTGDFLFITFIEPQGASHGELNQPSPQFQADRPQSVKVYGSIEGNR